MVRNQPLKLALQRTFQASIEEVWEMWTTPDGIESWWGPDGFAVTVHKIDLRPGGSVAYSMSATGPDQVDYMKKAGMPLTTDHRLDYTEVAPPRRLAWSSVVDFVPGVEPYVIETLLELDEGPGGTRLVITFDPMHDGHWTELARLGRESELGRLERVLAAKS